ncbi:hypothetical protein C0J52_27815 [Blattella germanica]|nr:hypothetical protein C0J52_27815 [Blattella germanica]
MYRIYKPPSRLSGHGTFNPASRDWMKTHNGTWRKCEWRVGQMKEGNYACHVTQSQMGGKFFPSGNERAGERNRLILLLLAVREIESKTNESGAVQIRRYWKLVATADVDVFFIRYFDCYKVLFEREQHSNSTFLCFQHSPLHSIPVTNLTALILETAKLFFYLHCL